FSFVFNNFLRKRNLFKTQQYPVSDQPHIYKDNDNSSTDVTKIQTPTKTTVTRVSNDQNELQLTCVTTPPLPLSLPEMNSDNSKSYHSNSFQTPGNSPPAKEQKIEEKNSGMYSFKILFNNYQVQFRMKPPSE